MRHRAQWLGTIALAAAAMLIACDERPAPIEPPRLAPIVPFPSDGVDPILPLPLEPPDVDPALVELGRELWFDPILSGEPLDPGQTEDDRDPALHGEVTCDTCHSLARAGTDGLPRSSAPGRPASGVNVPTTFNLAYVFRFSWSGRFDDLDEMLTTAMEAPSAMATTWDACVQRLRASAPHRARFASVFPDGVTDVNLRAALRAYVLVQTTPNSRFDRYLRHEGALTEQERDGYRRFREHGCIACHQGVNVGGNMFQHFGIMENYFENRGTPVRPADTGLHQETGDPEDMHVFRVPSLRNVALTAPYFHDGSAPTLEQAVETMGRYQLGRALDHEDVTSIVAFLRTLTGDLSMDGTADPPGGARPEPTE